MASYDTVIVGFPIWWGVAPRIIDTFLESYDFSGKKIIPFCTSGGSGVGRSDTALHKDVSGDVKWAKGRQINRANEAEIRRWLAGVMAQTPKRAGKQSGGLFDRNKPAAAKEKHVWSTGDQKIAK